MKRVVAVVCFVAGAVCLFSSSAGAADVIATAWWQRPAEPVDDVIDDILGSGSPEVGEGNLLVAGDADGPSAVAAVRFRLADGEADPTLRIRSVDTGAVNVTTALVACRVESTWTRPESNPGGWDDRPMPTDECVDGRVASSAVLFDLADLEVGGLVDIVIQPAEGAEERVEFPEPTEESILVTATAVTTSTTTTTTTVQRAPFVSPPPANRSVDLAPAPRIITTTTVAPVVTVPEVLEVAASSPVPVAAPLLPADADDVSRTLGMALLAASLAAAAWSYLTPRPESELVGLGRFRRPLDTAAAVVPVEDPVADPSLGGLGRFARRRSEPPIPLQ